MPQNLPKGRAWPGTIKLQPRRRCSSGPQAQRQPQLAACPPVSRAGWGGGILTVAHALQEVLEGFSQLPGLQGKGQVHALFACLGFRGRGGFPNPWPGKGRREGQESHLCDLGEPPGICHLQGREGGELSRGPLTPHPACPWHTRTGSPDQTHRPALLPPWLGPQAGPSLWLGPGWGGGPHLQEGRGGWIQFGVALNLGTRHRLQQSEAPEGCRASPCPRC